MPASAQSAKEQKQAATRAALQKAVTDRQYIFQAQSVTPLSGRTRILTTPYSLSVKGDTLSADLPYFGQAYSADYGGTDGGIRFETTDFTYSLTRGTKESTQVLIVPKGQPNAGRITLDIGAAGYATVQVQSTNRQNISFYGMIVSTTNEKNK